MKFEITERERNAVLLYAGCIVKGTDDDYYHQENAYRAFNLLMMEGQSGERVRICAEGQRPNSINIRRWEKTLAVLEDLFAALCKYSANQAAAGHPLPNPLMRGERKVNFDLMRAAGGTVAYTSTSRDEVLLPPMVTMACGPCRTEERPGIGRVCHYDITFTGFAAAGETADEEALTAFLRANAIPAADGLWNLVKKKLDADVFADDAHVYWKWKAAFRQLAIQRMRKIYREYFGT